MGEVLEYEAGRRFDSPALLGDIGEILNYRLAMRRAEEMVPQVTAMTRSPNAIGALRWLFGRPILRSADFAAAAGLPARTAHRLLRGLLEAGILTTVIAGNGRRATVLGFPALLNLVEGRRVP